MSGGCGQGPVHGRRPREQTDRRTPLKTLLLGKLRIQEVNMIYFTDCTSHGSEDNFPHFKRRPYVMFPTNRYYKPLSLHWRLIINRTLVEIMVRSVALFAFLSVASLIQAASIEERLSRLEEEVLGQQAQTSAAFSVRLDVNTEITDATVLFGQVDLNVGGGFDASTGMDICTQLLHLIFQYFYFLLKTQNMSTLLIQKTERITFSHKHWYWQYVTHNKNNEPTASFMYLFSFVLTVLTWEIDEPCKNSMNEATVSFMYTHIRWCYSGFIL